MNMRIIGQLAGVAVLTIGLAGCMDITSDVEILSETDGRITTTSVMSAEIYAMTTSGMAAATEEGETDGFCNEEGATLTENADGSATCVVVVEGTFEELSEGDEGGGAVYEVVSPGVVKVSFSTESMKGELGANDEDDEQTKAMMLAFFEGHAITIRVRGKEVLDTNMTRAGDGAAEVVIPFVDLINGTLEMPDTLYATVQTD